MKKMCFGTLMKILYRNRNNGVTNAKLCGAIYSVYGWSMDNVDDSHPSHLKSGQDNIIPEVKTAAMALPSDEAAKLFNDNVVCFVKKDRRESIVRAIKDVLRNETDIPDSAEIGYDSCYTKQNILVSSTFEFSALLASVFYYSIVYVENKPYKDNIKEIDDAYIDSFIDSGEKIYLESLSPVRSTALAKTTVSNFDRVFEKVTSSQVMGLTNPTSIEIFRMDINNCKFKYRELTDYLTDNIANYVQSRNVIAGVKAAGTEAGSGIRALKAFSKAYNASSETVLGEMLLYLFLTDVLDAPKIMSKIEFSKMGPFMQSKSDGVHLLTLNDGGQLIHQLVFGASDIRGDLTAAVDRAFEKIVEIENDADHEIEMVENISFNSIFDEDTTDYVKSIILPRKASNPKPDMAFGAFLGYSIIVPPGNYTNTQYRTAVMNQMKSDIYSVLPYIEQKVRDNGLENYSFYFYVVPFNDADVDRTKILEDIVL